MSIGDVEFVDRSDEIAAELTDLDCYFCGMPATCIGAYEGQLTSRAACDACCGHACEDGHCEPIGGGNNG